MGLPVGEWGRVVHEDVREQGFVHGWIAALAAALVLAMAAPALPGFGQRFAFVLMLGVFTTVWAEPSHSIWWWRTCGASTWFAVYGLGAWGGAAVALAAFVKTPRRDLRNP